MHKQSQLLVTKLTMSSGQLKASPVFVEDEDYLSWKNDAEVWEMFTDLCKKKQGPAVSNNDRES